MPSKQQIKNRTRSVLSVKQITRVLEMVSAAKLQKARIKMLNARFFSDTAMDVLKILLTQVREKEIISRYIGQKIEKKICLVVAASDKGLCGAFNNAIMARAVLFIEEKKKNTEIIDVAAVGRKVKDAFRIRGIKTEAEFFNFSKAMTLYDIAPLMDWLTVNYEAGRWDAVYFCSTIFISAFYQTPKICKILPFDKENFQPDNHVFQPDYFIEPSTREVFDEIVKELINVRILYLMFESNVSEHSARMIAMKNASENTDEILKDLNRETNKVRQEQITQELAEIISAKELLEI